VRRTIFTPRASICAKVARYAERIHHPDRLLHPLVRKGPKGSGQFAAVSWDDALDVVAEKFLAAEARYGSEAVWPYYYAGTMGLIMRDGINRLRHVKKYSGLSFHHLRQSGLDRLHRRHRQARRARSARDGALRSRGDLGHQSGQHAGQRDDPRGASTQGARRQDRRGRHLPERHHGGADLAVLVRPGTDGALACAVMHCLFRDGFADREYLGEIHRRAARAGRACAHRSPAWASQHHRLPGRDHRGVRRAGRPSASAPTFRLGYGFARSRNGAANMHAASCIAAVRGSWTLEGGGAFHNNGAIYHWNKTITEGLDVVDPECAHARPVAHRADPGRRAGRADQGHSRSRRC
jgi:anaerobic selenocysteine-containing dehydrogenase